MDNTKDITILSLCTGYAGIDLGIKGVFRNTKVICYCELEAYNISNLVQKIEGGLLDTAPIWTNLKTFPWACFSQRVDILTAGFPCQPFSTAGKGKATKDKRHLFPYIKKGIMVVKPAFVFFENVEGIITRKRNRQSVLWYVLKQLEKMGYRTEAGIFSALECDAPHHRKRVFILAHKKGMGYPQILNVESTLWGSEERTYRPICMAGETRESSLQNAWPSFQNEPPKEWEPKRSHQPQMARVVDGPASGMVYGDLCKSLYNRASELRLLGNGVVPATAEKAFRVLYNRLFNDEPKPKEVETGQQLSLF